MQAADDHYRNVSKGYTFVNVGKLLRGEEESREWVETLERRWGESEHVRIGNVLIGQIKGQRQRP